MKFLLVLVVLAVWFWIVYVLIGEVLGAFGLIPAIIVGILLLAPRWGSR